MKVAHQVALYFVVVALLVLAGMGIMLNRVYAINIAHQRLIQENKELQLSINLLVEIDNLLQLTESLPQEGLVGQAFMSQVSKLVSVLSMIRDNSTKVEDFEEASHVLTEKKEFLDIYAEFDEFRRTAGFLRMSPDDPAAVIKGKILDELSELRISGRRLQAIYMDSMADASAYAERARKQALSRTIIVFIVVLLLLGLAAGWFIYLINKNTRAMVEHEKGLTIGLLAQSLAHEIRNPLGIIKSSTSVIRNKLTAGSEEHEIAGFVTDEVDRINKLIGQLLQLSKGSKTELKLNDPCEIIQQVIRLMAGVTQKAGVPVDFDNQSKGEKVLCDADQIKQALINIILNAVQASRQGEGIRITARIDPKMYYVEVLDEGSGFKKGALKKAFEQFYTTKDNGLGLGLYVVKKIMDAHGGTITIVPSQPKGSRVVLGLKREALS